MIRPIALPVVWLVCWLVFVASGCTFNVRLVADYDPMIDEHVSELQVKTNRFLSEMALLPGFDSTTYAGHREFYAEVRAELAVLIDRAQILEDGLKRTPLSINLKYLKEQFDDLEALHRIPPPKTGEGRDDSKALQGAQTALDQSFRSVVKHLMYLKWNKQAEE
jgi:hypothetical protein